VPSPNARLGILVAGGTAPSPCPANSSYWILLRTFALIIQPRVLAILQGQSGSTHRRRPGTFSFLEQQVVNENFVTARVDHKFSEKDSLFGTYLFDDTPYHAPDGFDVVAHSRTGRQLVTP